jgi:hypothetical protein
VMIAAFFLDRRLYYQQSVIWMLLTYVCFPPTLMSAMVLIALSWE